MCTIAYHTLTKLFRETCYTLGFDRVWWTLHGLRRGGAIELLRMNTNLKLMLAGRWLSERSCKEHLRLGEVMLFKYNQSIPTAVWDRAKRVASLGSRSFSLMVNKADNDSILNCHP